jgi:hypothetical protein
MLDMNQRPGDFIAFAVSLQVYLKQLFLFRALLV